VLIGSGVHLSRALVVVWMLPAATVLAALAMTRSSRPARRRSVGRFANLVVLGYALAVIAIVLWPFHFDIETGRILGRGNWIPFRGTLGFLTSENSLQVRIGSRDFLANIMLFAPIGLLAGALRRNTRDAAIMAVTLIGMAFALEVLQGLTVAERTLDIDDAIAGSLGAVAAVMVGALLSAQRTPVSHRPA
jgi:glycopeptide antibiotics resistance protein